MGAQEEATTIIDLLNETLKLKEANQKLIQALDFIARIQEREETGDRSLDCYDMRCIARTAIQNNETALTKGN